MVKNNVPVKNSATIGYEEIKYTKNFNKITDFYLFNCPVNDTSRRATRFEDKGLTESNLGKFYIEMKKISNICKDDFQVDESKKIKPLISKYNDNYDKEYVFCNNSKGKTKAVFSAIRNALAHGDFKQFTKSKKNYYFFRNIYRGQVNAIIFISEKTLLSWYKLFMEYPYYYLNLRNNKVNKKNNSNK